MNNAFANQPFRASSGVGRQSAQTFFQPVGALFLHPIIALPALIYLMGGTPGQIAWYAIIAGLSYGIAAPVGSLVASRPELTQRIAGVFLVVQAIGFLILTFAALRADGASAASLLRMSAVGFLLLVLPTGTLMRIIEQSREYARAIISTLSVTMLGMLGVALAGLGVWRVSSVASLSPGELLGRILLPGALALLCATWLGLAPILRSSHVPYPARNLPTSTAPGFFTNAPLLRYSGFQILDGASRFADPFIVVAVAATLAPAPEWWGGAILAFALGEAIARFIMSPSARQPNSRSAIVTGALLRALSLIIVAFLPAMAATSLITDRNASETWLNWIFVAATLLLGAGYWLSLAGNASYVQSITPPSTRELTRAIVGGALTVAAFAPIIAVQMLDSLSIEILMRYAAAAAVAALLVSSIIVRPYSQPPRRRGSWSLRRQNP